MFKKIIAATIMSAALAVTVQTSVQASEGGGGEHGANSPYATLHNPDGSTVTSRGLRNGDRKVVKRNANGKIVKQRRIKKRSRSWAYNHTTGVGSVELVPAKRVRVMRGGKMVNRTVPGIRVVITPFGIGISN